MKILLIASIVLVGALASTERFEETYNTHLTGQVPLNDQLLFAMYKDYLMYYKGSVATDMTRFPIFKANVMEIIEHNQNPEKDFEMGINEYSDMTWEEFKDHFYLHEN